MRKKKKLSVLPILLLLLVVTTALGAGGTYLYHSQNEDLSETISEMSQTLKDNQQTVYVALTDIQVGDLLYEEATDGYPANIQKQNIFTGLDPEAYITSENIGDKAVVNIPAGNPVMTGMTTTASINHDTRIVEIAVANLMTTQQDKDYVDVRIVYPNGEDYVVLAKKQISDLNLENCIWTTYLSEEELLRLDSAMIDAYTISGTRIYTDKYVQSNLQEDAIPNYLVKPETIDLINTDPNILTIAQNTLNVQARNDLENRLSRLTEDQLSAVSSGFGLTDTAKTSVLLGTEGAEGDGSLQEKVSEAQQTLDEEQEEGE